MNLVRRDVWKRRIISCVWSRRGGTDQRKTPDRRTLLFVLILVGLAATTATITADDTASAILARADRVFTYQKFFQRSTMTMSGGAAGDQPEQIMETYFERYDNISHSLTLFTAPKRVAGTAYLMVGDELWVRFASTGRTRRLSSSARKNSAGGSDFSYDDLGGSAEGMAESYLPALAGESTIDGMVCHRIELSPKPGTSDESLYERVTVHIDTEQGLYRVIDLYEDGALVKRMRLDDYRTVQGYAYPFRITMEGLVSGTSTTITTQEFEVNSSRVDRRMFRSSYLESL